MTQQLPPTLRPAFAAPSATKGPWTLGAVLGVVACDLLVLGGVVTAWYNASNLATPEEQIAWVDLAGVAALVGVGGHAGWLVAGRRAVGRRTRALDRAVAAVLGPVADVGDLLVATTREQVLVGPQMTRYHLPGCALVADKPTEAVAEADATARGLRPCGMCKAA